MVTAIGLVFQPVISFGQPSVSGSVKNYSGIPLKASVSIIYIHSEAGILFSSTDSSGLFAFTLEDSLDISMLAVRVIAPGYEKSIRPIMKKNASIDFILQQPPKKLPEVTVQNSSPLLKTKGDTLSYLIAGISDRNDRSINDVLKKIPGIEIDENSVIKYQGQPINHLYIDGDDMLDNKYQFATKVIRPETVDRAEIIQHNQHIKMLNGIMPANAPAINLTIKEKHRFNISNSAELGAGSDNAVNTGFSSLAFKPKLKFINTVKYNNTGEALAANMGLSSAFGLATILENTGVSELILPPSTFIAEIPRGRYLNNHSSLVNINDFIKNKNELTWKLNAYLINEIQDQRNDESTVYYLPSDTVSYRQYQEIHNVRTLLKATVTTELNTLQKYITNALSVDRNIYTDVSGIFPGYNNINQQINSRAIRLVNNFNTIKLLRNQKFIELSAILSYEIKPQEMMVSPGLQANILNNNQPYLSAWQHLSIPAFFSNTSATYRINRPLFLQTYKAGIIIQHAGLNSAISIEQPNHSISEADSLFTNSLKWNRNKIYIESSYIFRIPKLVMNFTVPVSYNRINYDNSVFGSENAVRKLFITPAMGIEYKIGYESMVHAGYVYNAQFMGMNEVYQGAVLRNYQMLNAGNQGVQPLYNQNLYAGIDIKRPLKFLFFKLDWFYYERFADFIRSATLRNNIIQSVALPLKNTSYTSGISLSAFKLVYRMKTNFSLRYSWETSRSVQLQNSLLFPVTAYSHHLVIGVTWRPGTFISMSASTGQTWSTSGQLLSSTKDSQKQHIRQSLNKLECNIFPVKGMSLKLYAEYREIFEGDHKRASAFFSDARLQYKFLRKDIVLELAITNIANQAQFTTIYLSDNAFTTLSQAMRPRMIFGSMFITL